MKFLKIMKEELKEGVTKNMLRRATAMGITLVMLTSFFCTAYAGTSEYTLDNGNAAVVTETAIPGSSEVSYSSYGVLAEDVSTFLADAVKVDTSAIYKGLTATNMSLEGLTIYEGGGHHYIISGASKVEVNIHDGVATLKDGMSTLQQEGSTSQLLMYVGSAKDQYTHAQTASNIDSSSFTGYVASADGIMFGDTGSNQFVKESDGQIMVSLSRLCNYLGLSCVINGEQATNTAAGLESDDIVNKAVVSNSRGSLEITLTDGSGTAVLESTDTKGTIKDAGETSYEEGNFYIPVSMLESVFGLNYEMNGKLLEIGDGVLAPQVILADVNMSVGETVVATLISDEAVPLSGIEVDPNLVGSISYSSPNSYTAVASAQKLNLNGSATVETKNATVYNIGGNNYFKLRDIAAILKATSAKFDVKYDFATSRITITDNSAYNAVGGECTGAASGLQVAKTSTDKIYLNGQAVAATGYKINGNNYYKLRDVATALGDLSIDFTQATNTIQMTTATVETPSTTPTTPVVEASDMYWNGINPDKVSYSAGVTNPLFASLAGAGGHTWSGANSGMKGKIGCAAWITGYGVQIQTMVIEGASFAPTNVESYMGSEEDVAYMINDAQAYFKFPDAGKMTGDECAKWFLEYGATFKNVYSKHVGVQANLFAIAYKAQESASSSMQNKIYDDKTVYEVYDGVLSYGCHGVTTRY